MNLNQTTKTGKKPAIFIGFSLIIAAFLVTMSIVKSNHKQYFPVSTSEADDDMGAKGMAQFFFNARKNIHTNSMDYANMLAADIADRAMNKARHTPTTLPAFDWTSMGPAGTGGRTRAFLIDKNDPTHQTLFAGGVSGGIWKSTNGGATWDNTQAAISYSLNDTMSNINIGCIAQDANGAIYLGTGEWFLGGGPTGNAGVLGGGVFKSTDDGKTWRLLPKTVPTTTNNTNVAWAYVTRIAIRPDSFKVIYAATNAGLYISHDSGATWSITKSSTGQYLTSAAQDIKISVDGSVLIACVGGNAYYCYPQSAADNIFTKVNNTGAGRLPPSGARIEFAIAPSDPNRIYASFIDNSGTFYPSNGTSGIYMTETGKTNGGYWYDIGRGGTTSLDFYDYNDGTGDQATYDNTLAVFPNNEGALLIAGTTLSGWLQLNANDTVGSWSKITHYYPYYQGDPLWVHPDMHTIVFDPNNSSVVYIGCDGGLFQSTNATVLESTNQNNYYYANFQAINRNYNVTQYYSMCFSPQVNLLNQEGLGGGTQDNGSPYINGVGSYPNDGTDMTGGDGGGSVVSFLNPNIAYFTADDGSLERTGNLGNLVLPSDVYTSTVGDSIGANIDSVHQAAVALSARRPGSGLYQVFPVALYENSYDLLNHDSLQYIATKNYSEGDTIWPMSANGQVTYPYKLPKALPVGDTLTVPDRVVSRLAIGFCPTMGIWINGQGASNNSVVWMPIAGPHSTPTAYTGNAAISCLAWTPDGDGLFAADAADSLFRFTNINSIIANKFISGALWYEKPSSTPPNVIYTPGGNQVISTDLSSALHAADGGGDRSILSISVDPQNGNNILVTEGNYGQTSYVFYSNNALGVSPTFTAVQGNLPKMPVYGSVLDLRDSNGAWATNSAMLATEHGIYTTTNITAGSVSWVKNNKGLANCLVLAIKQQTRANWQCNNSGDIYIGTFGRGAWVSRTDEQTPTAIPTIASSVAENNLLVYPNPMTTQGNIEYNLASADNIIITIYDMQGRVVKTMNMENQAPGNHLVSFETDKFFSGTYFASLTGTNFRKVSKFIVFK